MSVTVSDAELDEFIGEFRDCKVHLDGRREYHGTAKKLNQEQREIMRKFKGSIDMLLAKDAKDGVHQFYGMARNIYMGDNTPDEVYAHIAQAVRRPDPATVESVVAESLAGRSTDELETLATGGKVHPSIPDTAHQAAQRLAKAELDKRSKMAQRLDRYAASRAAATTPPAPIAPTFTDAGEQAAHEWNAMSAADKGQWVDESIYVAARKAELRGGCRIVKINGPTTTATTPFESTPAPRDPEAHARQEWAAMSTGERDRWFNEDIYVAARKAEIRRTEK